MKKNLFFYFLAFAVFIVICVRLKPIYADNTTDLWTTETLTNMAGKAFYVKRPPDLEKENRKNSRLVFYKNLDNDSADEINVAFISGISGCCKFSRKRNEQNFEIIKKSLASIKEENFEKPEKKESCNYTEERSNFSRTIYCESKGDDQDSVSGRYLLMDIDVILPVGVYAETESLFRSRESDFKKIISSIVKKD